MVKILTVTNLKIDPRFTVADFQLTRPEDYEDIELKFGPPLLAAGSIAPDWTLKTPAGESISLESLRGNVVVMDFWATWCAPCLVAMPEMQEIHEHFKGRPVRVFGISCREKEDGDPAGLMKSRKYTYALLVDGNRVAYAYNVLGLPTLYVIDPEGNVGFSFTGGGGEGELRGIIEKLLPDRRTSAMETGS